VEITRRTDYAVRMMLELARAEPGVPVSVRALSERQGVPYAFARGIQRGLVDAKLAESRRGVHGGLVMTRPASEVSLLDIIEAIEGPLALNMCTSDPGWCARMGGCSVHQVWKGADNLLRDYLGSKSLEGLIR
jgi:Rrf2 family protein